jgi:hypothetical protein
MRTSRQGRRRGLSIAGERAESGGPSGGRWRKEAGRVRCWVSERTDWRKDGNSIERVGIGWVSDGCRMSVRWVSDEGPTDIRQAVGRRRVEKEWTGIWKDAERACRLLSDAAARGHRIPLCVCGQTSFIRSNFLVFPNIRVFMLDNITYESKKPYMDIDDFLRSLYNSVKDAVKNEHCIWITV